MQAFYATIVYPDGRRERRILMSMPRAGSLIDNHTVTEVQDRGPMPSVLDCHRIRVQLATGGLDDPHGAQAD